MTAPAIVVGPMPPPVHGAAVVTSRMAELFAEQLPTIRLNVAVAGKRHTPTYHSRRLGRHLAVSLTVLRRARARRGCVYLSVPGGASAAEMLMVCLAARVRRAPIILHHHSFNYLMRRSRLHQALFAVAGGSAVHIALCDEMADSLRRGYATVTRVEIWSNRHPMDLPPTPLKAPPAQGAPMAIGHMANLSVEKGLDVVLEVLRRGLAQGLDLTLHIAGEPTDSASARLLELAGAEFGDRVRRWGFVSGSEKQRFLDCIDVFLFPSRYTNEAEPIVVLEALARGVACLTTSIGCLGSMPGVTSVKPSDHLAEELVSRLAEGSFRLRETGGGYAAQARDPHYFVASLLAALNLRDR